jgi:hypothetical protein
MHSKLREVTATPDPEDITVAQRRRRLFLFPGITLLFGVITWFYMGRALTSCNSVVLTGIPGDATAGFTWLTWADRSSGPLPGFSHMTNAPFGESLSIPHQVTAALPFTTMWLLAKVVSPFCAYNLLVFLGYMSSALTMFAFMRWLTRNPWIGLFAGFAITYIPYHQIKALFHPDYLFNFIFVLFLWAFIVFWRRPALWPATAMALTTAACAYIEGYFILLGGLLVISTVTGALLIDFLVLRRPSGYRKERLNGLACYAGMTAGLVSPIIWVLYKYSDVIARSLNNIRGNRAISAQANIYSARPYEYLLPPVDHPLLPGSYKALLDRGLHGSNYIETTVYVGIVVLVLAGVAWNRLSRHRDMRVEEVRGVPLTFLISLMTFVLITALATSFPPILHVFGLPLPTLSWLIVHLTSVWRAFSRLYLVLETCLVILAGLGLWFTIRHRRPALQAVISIAVVMLVFVDFLTQSRALVWSPSQAPDVYKWLRTQKNVRTVAEYPLDSAGGTAYYMTYQMIDGKARLNSARIDESPGRLQNSIIAVNDSQTLPVLRALGVQLLLSHSRLDVDGLKLRRYDYAHDFSDAIWTFLNEDVASSATDDAVWAYSINPGEKAAYAVVAAGGFQRPFIDDNIHAIFRLRADGQLKVQRMPGVGQSGLIHVTLTVEAPGVPGIVSFVQQGRVRWRGPIGHSTRVAFDADPDMPIDVVPVFRSARGLIQLADMRAQP